MKAVILDGHAENPGDLSWDGIASLVDELEVYDYSRGDDIFKRSAGADILITNKTPITRELIEAVPTLKFVAVTATGYNVVDCAAAREHGIDVANIPAYSTDGVAQLVFSLLLELVNSVALHNDSVKSGDWVRSEHFCYTVAPLTELAGKTMGIIGFGRIGSAVAAIANAFRMKVLVCTPHTRSYSGFGEVDFVDMDTLVKESDVITLHCPLTKDTEGLVNKDFIGKMKKTAFLINTSRGQVINEADLAFALDSSLIAGAGVDVLSVEPPRADNPLLKCKKCLITPHIAWASFEARSRLMNILEENVKGFLEGKKVNIVN